MVVCLLLLTYDAKFQKQQFATCSKSKTSGGAHTQAARSVLVLCTKVAHKGGNLFSQLASTVSTILYACPPRRSVRGSKSNNTNSCQCQ